MSNDTPGRGQLREKSDVAILAEYYYWQRRIDEAKGWGAALAAAIEFRDDAAREIRRRGLTGLTKE